MAELALISRSTIKDTTLGSLYIGARFECYTLEDRVREIPGVPVFQWKIPKVTAIPSGRYEIVLENSPKFGPDTMTLKHVPGFDFIRIHSGNDDSDTEGCILVGQEIDEDPDGDGGNIRGGTSRPALARLKSKVRNLLEMGKVYITITRVGLNG